MSFSSGNFSYLHGGSLNKYSKERNKISSSDRNEDEEKCFRTVIVMVMSFERPYDIDFALKISFDQPYLFSSLTKQIFIKSSVSNFPFRVLLPDMTIIASVKHAFSLREMICIAKKDFIREKKGDSTRVVNARFQSWKSN